MTIEKKVMRTMESDTLLDKIKEGKAVFPGAFDPCFKKPLIECPGLLADIIHKFTDIPVSVLEKNIVIQNPEYTVGRKNDKRQTSDILVSVLDNSIILEMDTSYHAGTAMKSLAYISRDILSVITGKKDYSKSHQYILIDFSLEKPSWFPNVEDTHLTFYLSEEKYRFHFVENFKIYFVNLFKILDIYYNKSRNLDNFEKEMLLFMITDKEELSHIVKGNKNMEQAKRKLEDLSSQEGLFTEYELKQLDEYCDMMGKEEARKEGKIEVAKSLISQDIDFSVIQKATGLSLDELNILKEEI